MLLYYPKDCAKEKQVYHTPLSQLAKYVIDVAIFLPQPRTFDMDVS